MGKLPPKDLEARVPSSASSFSSSPTTTTTTTHALTCWCTVTGHSL